MLTTSCSLRTCLSGVGDDVDYAKRSTSFILKEVKKAMYTCIAWRGFDSMLGLHSPPLWPKDPLYVSHITAAPRILHSYWAPFRLMAIG